MDFVLNLTLKELRKRTSKKYFSKIKLLTPESAIYKKLSKDEKTVLMYLVKASSYFETINLKLENHNNIDFLNFLNNEIAKGNEKARLTKILFDAQKSMFSPDALGNKIVLAKNIEQTFGKGFYPTDLTISEFHKILNKMLDNNMIDEVKQIVSQRTVVIRDGEILKAIDYVNYFSEFKNIVDCLKMAKFYCKNEKFCDFLDAQINALSFANPKFDAEADIIWANLDENCPFEFTITRESYEEQMTTSILENSELFSKITKYGIEIFTKDSLGCRVGIVNKSGTRFLKKLQGLSKISRELMPEKEKYSQSSDEKIIPQTAVDVDIITLTGEEGAYRAGIVLAQNLPNDDKISLKLGGGRRNVYHRQIRKRTNKKLYKNLITESQYEYFNVDADHWGTVCHENTHSLGPNSSSSLGKFSSILEEYKADMGMYAFLNEFVNEKIFTERQAKQIVVTNLAGSFLKAKPSIEQAHRTRSCMIVYRMISENAINFDKEGKLVFDFDKVISVSKQMMQEVIEIQLEKNLQKAEEYIKKWFVWDGKQQKIAEIIKKYSKKLNGYLLKPLEQYLLSITDKNDII